MVQTYILVGDDYENNVVQGSDFTRNRPGAIILRSSDYPDINDALKQIKAPANVEMHVHGGPNGNIEWNKKNAIRTMDASGVHFYDASYAQVFSRLPEGTQNIIVAACFGGSADTTRLLSYAPRGSVVTTLVSKDTVGDGRFISRYLENTAGVTDPIKFYTQALNSFNAEKYVGDADYWKKTNEIPDWSDTNPRDSVPHVLGLGGGSGVDLAVEAQRIFKMGDQAIMAQAIARAEAEMTSFPKEQFEAVAKKLAAGQQPGTAANPIDAARELQIAYSITAQYMDLSGEFKRLQAAAQNTTSARLPPPGKLDIGANALPASAAQELLTSNYFAAPHVNKDRLDVSLSPEFLKTPVGQRVQAVLAGKGTPDDARLLSQAHIEPSTIRRDGHGGVTLSFAGYKPAGSNETRYFTQEMQNVTSFITSIENGATVAQTNATNTALASTSPTLQQGVTAGTAQANILPKPGSNGGLIPQPARDGQLDFQSFHRFGQLEESNGTINKFIVSNDFLKSDGGKRFSDFLNPSSLSLSNWVNWNTSVQFSHLKLQTDKGVTSLSFDGNDPAAVHELNALKKVMELAQNGMSTNGLQQEFHKLTQAADPAKAPALQPAPASMPGYTGSNGAGRASLRPLTSAAADSPGTEHQDSPKAAVVKAAEAKKPAPASLHA